ncbi:MAG: 2,3-dimethylmalate lyase [Gaiellales bacterium]|nr:2,3-dimethylmalate lyase [Gaiellales bacterium]
MGRLITDRSPGATLRERLSSGTILVVPGAFDALTGRLLERAGFEAIYRGGYAASAAAFGLPDLGITSSTEMADHARRLCSAVGIPVIADADTGYGEVAQVIRTVNELERAGVAAIQLEDQVFPKRCGHMDGKDVIAPELHEQKLRAALDARSDPATLIVARTDALAVTGLEDAIARAHRYAAAGADVLFIDAPRSEDELRAIGSAGIGKPLLVNVSEYGRTPDLGAAAFEQLGFAIALYPTSTLFAASQSTKELAATLRETGSTRGMMPRMMPFDELNETLGKDDWDVT